MNRAARFLLPLLSPPALLFEAIVRVRNGMYSKGAFRALTLPNPVISVGNITAGGTGKTPLTIQIANMIAEFGALPALLSRGYGREQPGTTRIVSPSAETDCEVSCLGDEPALIRRHVPTIWLGISADRYNAACAILREEPDAIFILDDGFQHRKLKRTLDIVVVDASQLLQGNHVLPRGSLREPVAGLRRAHIVMVNGNSKSVPEVDKIVRDVHPFGKVLHCRQEIKSLIPFAQWQTRAEGSHAPVKLAFLAAAIGNPGRFREDVEALGIEVTGTRFYRDHAVVRGADWADCAAEARRSGAEAVITTEKDAIKISDPPAVPLRVAIQITRIVEGDEFGDILKRAIEATR